MGLDKPGAFRDVARGVPGRVLGDPLSQGTLLTLAYREEGSPSEAVILVATAFCLSGTFLPLPLW